jgi:hypothetical protein
MTNLVEPTNCWENISKTFCFKMARVQTMQNNVHNLQQGKK